MIDKKIILALLIVSIALIGISSVSAHDVNAIDVGDIISIENNTIDENNGNILFVDELNSISIEDAPQNIDFSKCRNVTIFSKLSGQTSTVSVPEGYMIVIEGNNLTLKHM